MTSELVPWGGAGRATVASTSGPAAIAYLPARPIVVPTGVYVRVLKPVIDVTVAVLALVAGALPMLAIAAMIALTMGRPVLFRQQRIGLDGRPFEVLKFRTMRHDRRTTRLDVIHDRRRNHKSDDDPRHTAIGRVLRRYSLDELPQLFNVLRGEMSIVGPRPELVSVVEQYPPSLHQRHHVKPGLTGLWQVSARSGGPMHENGQWDLDYVERVSLRTDLRIIARTPSAMLVENCGS